MIFFTAFTTVLQLCLLSLGLFCVFGPPLPWFTEPRDNKVATYLRGDGKNPAKRQKQAGIILCAFIFLTKIIKVMVFS